MPSHSPTRVLTPAHERFRPLVDADTFFSAKLAIKKASSLLSIVDTALEPGEPVNFIAPASSVMPAADFVAATDRRFLAGTFKGIRLALPLAEVTFLSKRNFNSWSKHPDTLAVHHAGQQYNFARVSPPDHGILQEFAERARIIAEVANPRIFEQLAAARDAAHPSPPLPTAENSSTYTAVASTGTHADMDAVIAQLKQLNDLRESGVLSQQEFEQAKARLGFAQ